MGNSHQCEATKRSLDESNNNAALYAMPGGHKSQATHFLLCGLCTGDARVVGYMKVMQK